MCEWLFLSPGIKQRQRQLELKWLCCGTLRLGLHLLECRVFGTGGPFVRLNCLIWTCSAPFWTKWEMSTMSHSQKAQSRFPARAVILIKLPASWKQIKVTGTLIGLQFVVRATFLFWTGVQQLLYFSCHGGALLILHYQNKNRCKPL